MIENYVLKILVTQHVESVSITIWAYHLAETGGVSEIVQTHLPTDFAV